MPRLMESPRLTEKQRNILISFIWKVTVRDRACGIKGEFLEEMEVQTEKEARDWYRQFRSEYPSSDGYTVKLIKPPWNLLRESQKKSHKKSQKERRATSNVFRG